MRIVRNAVVSDVADLEQEFEPLRDTATEEELRSLEHEKVEGRPGYYGHDLHASIRRGYKRKIAAALDEAERNQAKTLGGWGIPNKDPNKLCYHLTCELVRRCQEAGGSDDEIVRHLKIIAEQVVRESLRANHRP